MQFSNIDWPFVLCHVLNILASLMSLSIKLAMLIEQDSIKAKYDVRICSRMIILASEVDKVTC